MDLSKFLSKVLGFYLLIISFIMLSNMHQFTERVMNLVHNEPVMLLTGFFTLIIGLLMVVSHNIWQWHWRVIITVLAWMTLLKGMSILYYPQYMDKLTTYFVHDVNIAYMAAAFDGILGLILIYLGFKRSLKD